MKLSAILVSSLLTVIPAVADGPRPSVVASAHAFESATRSKDDRIRREPPVSSRPSGPEIVEKSKSAEGKGKATQKPLPSRAHVWLT